MAGERTLQTIVDELTGRGERPALVAYTSTGSETWTCAQLAATTRSLAAGLIARGLAPGSFVGVMGQNSPANVVVRLALVAGGFIAAPIDDAASAEVAVRSLARCGARLVFTTQSLAGPLREAANGQLEHIYLLDAPDGDASSWRSLLGDGAAPLPISKPHALVAVIFTSGTTGEAKGVPLTHANLLVDIDALATGGFIDSTDRVVMPLPLHHAYPFMAGLMLPLACGAAIALPAGVAGPEIVRALQDSRATAMLGVPRLYQAMAQGILARLNGAGAIAGSVMRALLALSIAVRKKAGWRIGRVLMRPVRRRLAPELALLGCGGARLDEETAWLLEGLGFEVLTGYGLVETSSVSTYNRKGKGRIGTEGLPVPGTEIRIHNADADGIGEIHLRGPHVFGGYYHDAAATEAAFAEDHWFKTGDLGRLEPDGSVVVVGRSKEVIVLGNGKNIGPEEVESALAESPYIQEAAVLERRGDLVALVVPDMPALQRSATARVDELIRVEVTRACVDLEPYKRVTGYRLWREPLPRTRLGKIRRFQLPALYEGAERHEKRKPIELSAEDLALADEPTARTVVDILRRRFPSAEIGFDTSLQLDLAVDSLAWIEIAHETQEATGRAIQEDAIATIVTVRDFIRTVVAAPAIAAGSNAEVVLPALRPTWTAPLAWAAYWFLRILMRTAFRLEIRGRPPQDGRQMLVAVNHLSDLDPPIVAAALPWSFVKSVRWGADVNRVFDNGIKRAVARFAQVFPVDDRKPAETLGYAKAALAEGGHLIWFPESWRSPDGKLQQFSRGVGVMVMDKRPAVVPVRVEGTFEALPRHKTMPRLTPVRITFGETIEPAEFGACAAAADPAAAAAGLIRERMAKLDAGR